MKNAKKLFAYLGVSLVCMACFTQSAYATVAGHAQFVNGDVQVMDNLGRMHPVKKGDAVSEGDTLITAKAASAQIKMEDGGFVAVRADTRMKFDQFKFSGKADGTEKNFMSLFKGAFRAVSGLIGHVNRDNYRVTTPSATIGIRGTDYEVVVAEASKTNVALADLSWLVAQVDAPTPIVGGGFAAAIVNTGAIEMGTSKGKTLLQPGQGMVVSYGMNQLPVIKPIDVNLFPGAGKTKPTGQNGGPGEKKQDAGNKEQKKEEQKKEGDNSKPADKGNGEAKGNGDAAKQEGGATDSKQAKTDTSSGQAASTDSGQTGGGAATTGNGTSQSSTSTNGGSAGTTSDTASIRTTSTVDTAAPGSALVQGGGIVAPPTTVTTVVAPPPVATTTTQVVPKTSVTVTGGTTVNVTTGTATTSTGQTANVTQTSIGTQAQAAATAAATAAGATVLNLPVPTTPASTAIGTATTSVSTASTAVTGATALAPVNAATVTANATTAQAWATAAATQAAAAQAALTANGAFADSTASPANTATQNANTSAQTANTAVQGALTTVSTNNTALSTAQTAATAALSSANTNLTAANTSLTTATTQNGLVSTNLTAISTNQATISGNAAAMTILTTAGVGMVTAPTTLAQAVAAAQTAASQAAALEKAGDLVSAQAALATAQAAQAIVNAALAANAAVTTATTSAAAASTFAGTANTQVTAAQTASTNATAALSTSSTNLATLNTNSTTVANNAPIAAYNNPAVAGGSFVGVTMLSKPVTGGYNTGFIPNQPLQANTTYVLDGTGNLVEMRNAQFQQQTSPNGTLLTPTITSAAGADIKWSGGTAADTFKLADNSIYMGRWVTPTVTVTDNTAPFNAFIYTPRDSVWAVVRPSPTGYVQSLVGSVTYTKAGNTTPVDATGITGTLNSATLTANFTSQLVNAAVNLTMGATSTMAGTYNLSATGVPIQVATSINPSGFGVANASGLTTTCTGTCAAGVSGYSGDLGGSFAGTAAGSVAMSYDIWPTVAAGSPMTSSVHGLVALTTATPATAPASPAAGSYISGFMIPVPVAGGGYTVGTWVHGAPIPNTSIQLDGAGNMVKLNGISYQEMGSTAPILSIASANMVWSGGTVADTYHSASGNINFGRYLGGSVTVTDLATTAPVAPFTINLAQAGTMVGPTSTVWAYGVAPTVSVQSLVGTTAYTKTGNTTPFDSVGGLGVLNSATLTADFSNQIITAALNLTMNTGTYASDVFNVAATMPVNAVTAADPSGFKTANAGGSMTVGCSTGPCTGGAFTGEVRGTFAGATATDAALGYSIYATSAAAPASIVNGLVAFNTATAPTVLAGGPYAAYAGGDVAVEYVTPFMGNSSFGLVAKPANVVLPVANPATGGTQTVTITQVPGANNNWSFNDTFTVANPVALVPAMPAGMQASANTLNTYSQSTTSAFGSSSLGGGSNHPPGWGVGPQAYLDANGVTALPTIATLTYGFDGATVAAAGTVPTDISGNGTVTKGTLNSASLSVNLVTNLITANLGITMGANSYGATTNISLGVNNVGLATGANYASSMFSGAATVTGGAAAAPCTAASCGGTISGAFTGQNYAGALLGYSLFDSSAGLTNTTGVVAMKFVNGTNTAGGALALAPSAAAPTGTSFVWDGFGIQQVTTATVGYTVAAAAGVPAGVLNAYGGTGFNTSVTCTLCTTNIAASNATTGISFGTWDQGTSTSAFTGTGTATSKLYWISAPEPMPAYLPQVLTTPSVVYNLTNSAVGTTTGATGTITAGSLTAHFNTQSVAISLTGGAIGTAATGWSASTTNAPIWGNCSSSGCFVADSFRAQNQPGYLTVVIDGNSSLTNAAVYGQISGQLVGNNLNGGILSLDLWGPTGAIGAQTGFVNIQGVAAFSTATANDPATPYRLAAAIANDPVLGNGGKPAGGFQNSASVTIAAAGLTQLMDANGSTTGGARTIALAGGTTVGTSAFTGTSTATGTACNPCTDAVSGIQWGRWSGASATITDLVTNVAKTLAVAGGGIHWMASPVMTGPTTLPTTAGTYTYVMAGGTNPTDSAGNVGTLNSASLSANFVTQTASLGVNATVGTTNIAASASNVAIDKMATFSATAFNGVGTAPNGLTVTCTGAACGATDGHIVGAFGGAGAAGAAMMYGFVPNTATPTNMITGIAVFHR